MNADSASVIISRAARGFTLTAQVRLPAAPEDVFPYFADAHNLEALTPAHLRFHVLTPGPIVMREGLRIDYRLRLRGIPLRWQSEISAWDPPHRFVDTQIRGPYRWWVHEHTFIEDGGGTIARDRVDYGVVGGRCMNAMFVCRDLERIFKFRAARLLEEFGEGEKPRKGGEARRHIGTEARREESHGATKPRSHEGGERHIGTEARREESHGATKGGRGT